MNTNELKGKKLLVLGSDYGTYDLVVEAKRLGIWTIACDLMETSPTKQEADEAWLVSTADLVELEQLIVDNHIDGVIAGASEFNIDKVRKLTKKLGMPLYCKNDSA